MILFIVILVALYGLITSNNLIKKVMCLNIIQNMIILFFINTGYVADALPPVLVSNIFENYVDPMPQALMLTAIVIGVCFNTLALTIIVKIYFKYKSIEVPEISER